MSIDNICRKCNSSEVQHRNLHLCAVCYKKRRAVQTKVIARRWYGRDKAGLTGHRYFYRGTPTVAAMKNPRAALKSLVGKPKVLARQLETALKRATVRFGRAVAKEL